MENYVEKINWEKYKKPIVIEKVTFNTAPEFYLYKKAPAEKTADT